MSTVAQIGNFGAEYSTENDVRIAFEALGWDVIPLQENRVSLGQLYDASRRADLVLITSTWPDAIPMPEWLDLVHDCALVGRPVCTLHLDVFWGVSRGARQFWREPMFHTGTIFTADGDHEAEWELLGKRHVWLPPAVRHTAVRTGRRNPAHVCDVAFFGADGRSQGYHSADWPQRAELVDALTEMCGRRGWSWKNPGGQLPKVGRGEMNDALASCKVTIGDSLCLKREQARYFSDRAFETPGRGGFLIMPQIDVLSDMYDGQLPMFPWQDYEALEAMIERYLADDAERARVVEATQSIVRDHHTYVNRVRTLLETVGLT